MFVSRVMQVVDLPSPIAFAALRQGRYIDEMPYRTGDRGLNSSWFGRGDRFVFGRLRSLRDNGALLGSRDLVQTRL